MLVVLLLGLLVVEFKLLDSWLVTPLVAEETVEVLLDTESELVTALLELTELASELGSGLLITGAFA